MNDRKPVPPPRPPSAVQQPQQQPAPRQSQPPQKPPQPPMHWADSIRVVVWVVFGLTVAAIMWACLAREASMSVGVMGLVVSMYCLCKAGDSVLLIARSRQP